MENSGSIFTSLLLKLCTPNIDRKKQAHYGFSMITSLLAKLFIWKRNILEVESNADWTCELSWPQVQQEDKAVRVRPSVRPVVLHEELKSVAKVLGKIPKPAVPTIQEDLSQDL